MSKEDQEVLEAKIAEGKKQEKAQKKKERKAKADSFWKDFKAFITRGNIIDMAIGVIVGSAFTAIITALSNQILKPIIDWVLALIVGTDSLSEVFTFLKKAYVLDANGAETSEVDLVNSIYIDWGAFINAIINFLLVALCLFVILRVVTRASKRFSEATHAKQIAEAAAAAEAKKAEDDAKAAEDAKAAAEAAAEEAKANEEKAEIERQFYENVRRQTELLEKIANK